MAPSGAIHASVDLGKYQSTISIIVKGSNAAIEDAPNMAALRARLIERIQKFGVEDWPLPGRDDGFSALCYRGKAFAHFHSDNELDVRLRKES
jgi:Family of unknown function (DUF5519)